MLEEIASLFAATTCSCTTLMTVSYPAQLATDLVPPPLEHGQPQVIPQRCLTV